MNYDKYLALNFKDGAPESYMDRRGTGHHHHGSCGCQCHIWCGGRPAVSTPHDTGPGERGTGQRISDLPVDYWAGAISGNRMSLPGN